MTWGAALDMTLHLTDVNHWGLWGTNQRCSERCGLSGALSGRLLAVLCAVGGGVNWASRGAADPHKLCWWRWCPLRKRLQLQAAAALRRVASERR